MKVDFKRANFYSILSYAIVIISYVGNKIRYYLNLLIRS